jgi:hypothetical protein
MNIASRSSSKVNLRREGPSKQLQRGPEDVPGSRELSQSGRSEGHTLLLSGKPYGRVAPNFLFHSLSISFHFLFFFASTRFGKIESFYLANGAVLTQLTGLSWAA